MIIIALIVLAVAGLVILGVAFHFDNVIVAAVGVACFIGGILGLAFLPMIQT